MRQCKDGVFGLVAALIMSAPAHAETIRVDFEADITSFLDENGILAPEVLEATVLTGTVVYGVETPNIFLNSSIARFGPIQSFEVTVADLVISGSDSRLEIRSPFQGRERLRVDSFGFDPSFTNSELVLEVFSPLGTLPTDGTLTSSIFDPDTADFLGAQVLYAVESIDDNGTPFPFDDISLFTFINSRLTAFTVTPDQSDKCSDADLDASGELDFFDWAIFLELAQANDPGADLVSLPVEGQVDVSDYLFYETVFADGCE